MAKITDLAMVEKKVQLDRIEIEREERQNVGHHELELARLQLNGGILCEVDRFVLAQAIKLVPAFQDDDIDKW